MPATGRLKPFPDIKARPAAAKPAGTPRVKDALGRLWHSSFSKLNTLRAVTLSCIAQYLSDKSKATSLEGEPTVQGRLRFAEDHRVCQGCWPDAYIRLHSPKRGRGLLASVDPNFEWIRLAQRIPVRIALERVPPDVRLVAGLSATVVVRH
jgi:hypothetical protein